MKRKRHYLAMGKKAGTVLRLLDLEHAKAVVPEQIDELRLASGPPACDRWVR
jgi:hypothetical protein